MFRITRIAKHEIGLWFRHRDLHRVLQHGTYLVPMLKRDHVEVVSKLTTRFLHSRMPAIVREPALRNLLHIVDLTDEQRALVWRDGRLESVLSPGLHSFWKEPHAISVEVFDIHEPRFVHLKIDAVIAHADAPAQLRIVDVDSSERLLVFDAGELIESCSAGRHAFWNHGGRVSFKAIDLREQTLDVQGQEIMTADRVTLRLNVVVTFQVDYPELSVQVVSDAPQTVYRDTQLALRTAVGGRTLEQLLGDKELVCDEVRETVANRALEFGVKIRSIGIRDVILPGEMKAILNQVIEAQKQAEANLIRRREETAAARSQANTAKLLADNPVLARMKELEALQEILRGTNANFVFGAGDLREQFRSLIARDQDA